MDAEGFRDGALIQKPITAAVLRADKMLAAQLEDTRGDTENLDRVKLFVWTDRSTDSYGTAFEPDGWNTKTYMKNNPVGLWAHDTNIPPISNARAIYFDGAGPKAKGKVAMEYMPAEINPFADSIYRMLDGGWLRGISHRFRSDGFVADPEDPASLLSKKQRLIELSNVPIPANDNAVLTKRMAQAVAGAREDKIDVTPLLRWAEQILDREIPGDERSAYEVWLAAKDARSPQVQIVVDTAQLEQSMDKIHACTRSLNEAADKLLAASAAVVEPIAAPVTEPIQAQAEPAPIAPIHAPSPMVTPQQVKDAVTEAVAKAFKQ